MNGWAIGVNNLVWERAIRNFLFLCHREQDFPVPLSWDTHTHTHTRHPCVHLRECLICLACVLSHVWLFANPWTVAHQAPLFMEFSRQEYCSELPFPPPGDIPDSGVKPQVLISPALTGGFFTIFITRATWGASEISFMKKIKWSGMSDRGRQRRATFYADFYLKWSLCFLACWFFNCVFFGQLN